MHRPALFSTARPGDGSRRILASLESSGKANTPSARLARLRPAQLVALLTLLAVVAACIASFSYLGLAPARHNEALAPVAPMAPLVTAVSYTHLRAHETSLHLVCRPSAGGSETDQTLGG